MICRVTLNVPPFLLFLLGQRHQNAAGYNCACTVDIKRSSVSVELSAQLDRRASAVGASWVGFSSDFLVKKLDASPLAHGFADLYNSDGGGMILI